LAKWSSQKQVIIGKKVKKLFGKNCQLGEFLSNLSKTLLSMSKSINTAIWQAICIELVQNDTHRVGFKGLKKMLDLMKRGGLTKMANLFVTIFFKRM